MLIRLGIYFTPDPIPIYTLQTDISSPSPFPSLYRHATPDKFYIEACDEGANDVLVIDRASMEMTLTGKSC